MKRWVLYDPRGRVHGKQRGCYRVRLRARPQINNSGADKKSALKNLGRTLAEFGFSPDLREYQIVGADMSA